jgi:circadian clock protein KaiB
MTESQELMARRLEDALVARDESWYELTLIVCGASQLSTRAIANARLFCEKYLEGRYHLSIVDLHEHPSSALNGQVLAAPTLVKNQPLPVQKFVGDLSNTERLQAVLGLRTPDLHEAGEG